ncbi:4-coumarate--CoA ligase family protein [Rubrivirga sp. S365]|uniref:4-coumarate--CoA ligase family protein n=1 Tax=Rubrivirga litoralis TaxID=3075598 RepID=A0ABU3BLH8_9BACT|nr:MULTISPECIES: 4-coumarate--CoA ligase family protein [unclassified Rubrivirga]MDT0630118.1 4-coumarate--CoA ligase family protein [Rubrivirga sp. F394]MDT7855628.1 4-coumarate--CoA ligase family protein [Rubrivirga sp. S365]
MVHGPDILVPDAPLPQFVLKEAYALGDKPALIDGPTGRVLTYAQLAGGVERVAAALAARGFGVGDVFGILSPNLPEFPIAFHGAIRAGGVATTMNPLSSASELAHQLEDSGARYLLTVPPFLETAREAADAAGVEEVFVFGEGEGATPFASLLQETDGSTKPPELHGFDPSTALAALPYSSGTTGLPKGVMLTHRNLVANVVQFEAVDDGTPDDVLIAILPFFHIYGMTLLVNSAMRAGQTVVTMPRFDLEQFLQLMQDHRVTKAFLVPPILVGLAKHPLVDQYDLSALVRIVSGAAPLGTEVAAAVADRLGCEVKQGFGMTEASPVTHFVPASRTPWTKYGSVGPVVPGVDAKLADVDTGEEVPDGERGELLVRGPNVMKGYLGNDEATARTLDADGWLHTGDVAVVDEDGDFFIVDRVKELIKYKGYQVPPAELEALLLGHDAIGDAAVIPVLDEEAGEIPKAYVVLKPDHDLSADDVMAYVAERVAPYKKVREVAFVDEIPKSSSGKILRRVLVEQDRA